MKGLFTLLLCALLTLSGCKKQDNAAVRLVTQITVHHQNQFLDIADQKQMSQILNALRLTKQTFPPTSDPDTLDLPAYDITLTHSDGTTVHWQIKGNQYLRKFPGPWQETDPKQLSARTALLQTL